MKEKKIFLKEEDVSVLENNQIIKIVLNTK